MISVVQSASMANGDAVKVTLECGLNSGFSGLGFVGNTGELVNDGKERVKSALENLGIKIPAKKIIVNFSPAEIRKNANHFDLAIAVGLSHLLSGEKKWSHGPEHFMFAAELGLNGYLRPINAVVPFFLCAINSGLKGIIVSYHNRTELQALLTLIDQKMDDFHILGFSHLSQVLKYFMQDSHLKEDMEYFSVNSRNLSLDSTAYLPNNSSETEKTNESDKNILTEKPFYQENHENVLEEPSHKTQEIDFDDMVLNDEILLALKVIGTGMHHVFLRGAPGSGKSMLALRLPSILPKMNRRDHLEALKIHSTYFLKISESLAFGKPPFRAPHHQASAAAIIGTPDMPGEISLAHGGVLFLDEFPEYRRDLIESLREPLELGKILIVRAGARASRAARILLIAAANECPCGWFGSKIRSCNCSMTMIQKYHSRISGPIQNRIDIHLKLPEFIVGEQCLFAKKTPQNQKGQTQKLSIAIDQAIKFGSERNKKMNIGFNRDITSNLLLQSVGMSESRVLNIIAKVSEQPLNRRSLVRVLRLARSVADVDFSTDVKEEHLAQAVRWQLESLKKNAGHAYLGL